MSPHAASYSLLQSVLMYSHTCAHMGECSLIAAKNTWLAFIKYVGYIRPGRGEGDAPTCEWTCEVTSLTHSLSTYTLQAKPHTPRNGCNGYIAVTDV